MHKKSKEFVCDVISALHGAKDSRNKPNSNSLGGPSAYYSTSSASFQTLLWNLSFPVSLSLYLHGLLWLAADFPWWARGHLVLKDPKQEQ
jgi:hypothetical protein